ncbi:uncharacterized protein LOC119980860 isoform X2 [Tripterygium wilfordii]|uniref:uncharacterized protein LOC119980860 isoform X2 n=1 Tax=Tripterygium wilfordii TaxID=458696 RepID=UPI0018F7E5C8|nr:uncharacterized protein LOC119980860 isoform X2 [Tripterygium wilfordii]
MKKVKFRSMKELYGDSKDVLEPKVSPVLKANFRGQKHADDTKCIALSNRGSRGVDGSSRARLPTRHSSRLHSEGTTSQMAVKADYELSDDAAQGKGPRQFFISDTDMISPVSSLCNGRRCSSSETSNLVSVCSNHDSQDVSKDTEILEEVENLQTVADNCCLTKVPTFDETQKNSGLLDNWEESDHLVDGTSCICRSYYTDKTGGDYDGERATENLSYSSATLNSFSIIGKDVDDQPSSCCRAGCLVDVIDNANCGNAVICAQESSRPTSLLRNQSDLSENSSLRNSYFGATSLKVDPSDCHKQVESTLTTLIRTGGQRSSVHSFADSMKPDTEMNRGHSASETEKISDLKELLPKSGEQTAKPSRWQPHLQPQALDSGDAMGIVEGEVKMCNICGHPGREELLAICCKCRDGAEHTYCMHAKLDRVPEGAWVCEECMMTEEVEKQKQGTFERPDRVLRKSLSNNQRQNSGNSSTSNHNSTLELEVKGSVVEKSRNDGDSSSPCWVEKRPALNMEGLPVKRIRTLTINHTSSSMLVSRTKTVLCCASSFNSLDKRAVKPAHEGSVRKSKSFNHELSKVNVQLSYDCLQKQSRASENDTSDDKKEVVANMFSNENADLSNAADAKDKGQDFVKMTKKLKLPESPVTATVTDSGIYASVMDKKPAFGDGADDSAVKAVQCHEKTSNTSKSTLTEKTTVPADGANACAPLLSRSNDSSVKAVQCHEKTSNTSKSTGKFGETCSQNKRHKSIVKDEREHLEYSKEAAFTTKVKTSEDTSPPDGKPHPRCLPEYASAVDGPFWISTVPQRNYIWKGGFEIHIIRRGVKLSRFCDGIQAHLATGASPRVLEAVEKLPQTFLLKEVPRLSMWPAQFSENQATENNIALYFFAEDLKSYESSYNVLVENMIKNDLGLKGNFNGTELLVFASNLLPEGSKRWNNLSFLWGVFREGRVNFPKQIPFYVSYSNFSPSNQYFSLPSLSAINNTCFPGQSSESSLSSNIFSNIEPKSNFSTSLASPVFSSDKSVDDGQTKPSLEQKLLVPEENPDQQPHMVKPPTRSEQLSRDTAHAGSLQREGRETKRRPDIDLNLQADEECNLDTECNMEGQLEYGSQGPKLPPATENYFLEQPLISGIAGDTTSRNVTYSNLLARNQNNDDDDSPSLRLALPLFCNHSNVDTSLSLSSLSRK